MSLRQDAEAYSERVLRLHEEGWKHYSCPYRAAFLAGARRALELVINDDRLGIEALLKEVEGV